jgi:uncharacterized Zn-finger protein
MNSQINPQLSPKEILHVNSKKVSCDGGKGASGHPLVYLNMGKNDFVTCPYCSKFFTINNKFQSAVKEKNKIKAHNE